MRLQQAVNILNQYAIPLLLDPRAGLMGIAIGRKDEGPVVESSDVCITAFVERKLPRSDVLARNMIPFDELLRGLRDVRKDEVDVVETGALFRLQAFAGSDHAAPATVNTQKWFLAPRSGVSICNPTLNYPKHLDAGTLGFVVKDGSRRYIVSANHVLARENAATKGEIIVQPGSADLNGNDITMLAADHDVTAKFGIAKLSCIVPVPINVPGSSQPPQVSTVDVAMAELIESDRSDDAYGRLGFGGRFRGIGPDYQVDARGRIVGSSDVFKVGRSSGYTEGYISNISANLKVPFGNGVAIFIDQLAIRPHKDNSGAFSVAGDSGAALVNFDHQVVGMIIGGSPRRSIATPISEIIRQLINHAGVSSLTLVT